MSKQELLSKLTGEENPKFITERENVIINYCLELLKEKETENYELREELQKWESGERNFEQ
jgi:hypothetical protein